jgi:hypothetical protein
MAQTRFTCTLTTADEPACESYARVTVVDSEGNTARGCPRHAVGAVGHLRRPAVPAPVVRDHAVAAPEEEHHLASQSSAESGQPWLKTIGWPEPQSL